MEEGGSRVSSTRNRDRLGGRGRHLLERVEVGQAGGGVAVAPVDDRVEPDPHPFDGRARALRLAILVGLVVVLLLGVT